MIITCPQCQARTKLDDAKVPARPFTVKCPKCQGAISVAPPATPSQAADGGPTPAPPGTPAQVVAVAPTDPALAGPATPSAPVGGAGAVGAAQEGGVSQDMLGKILPALFAAAAGTLQQVSADPGRAWQRRQALLCLQDPVARQRAKIVLDANGYGTHVAEAAASALTLFQEQRVGFILVDPQFDPQGQGGATILRTISALPPKQRRRVYLVLVSPNVRTLDIQTAFLSSVNLTVNSADIETLPQILQRSLRDFNELYRPLNEAAGTPPL